eukprot:1338050-Amphidinium_carterae.1
MIAIPDRMVHTTAPNGHGAPAAQDRPVCLNIAVLPDIRIETKAAVRYSYQPIGDINMLLDRASIQPTYLIGSKLRPDMLNLVREQNLSVAVTTKRRVGDKSAKTEPPIV